MVKSAANTDITPMPSNAKTPIPRLRAIIVGTQTVEKTALQICSRNFVSMVTRGKDSQDYFYLLETPQTERKRNNREAKGKSRQFKAKANIALENATTWYIWIHLPPTFVSGVNGCAREKKKPKHAHT